jgi:hypothetical protein
MYNDAYGASEEQAAEYVRMMTEQLFAHAFRSPDVFINYEGVPNKPLNRDLSQHGGKIKVCQTEIKPCTTTFSMTVLQDDVNKR